MSFFDVKANKQLRSLQMRVNIVHFKDSREVLVKNIPLERWIQLVIVGSKL